LRLGKSFLRLAFTHSAAGENKFCGLEKIFFKPHFFDCTEHRSRFKPHFIPFFLFANFISVIRVWENEWLHLIFVTPLLFRLRIVEKSSISNVLSAKWPDEMDFFCCFSFSLYFCLAY